MDKEALLINDIKEDYETIDTSIPYRRPINPNNRTDAIDYKFKYFQKLNLNATKQIHPLILNKFLTYDEDVDVGGGENISYIPSKQGGSNIISAIFNLTTTIVGGKIKKN